MPSQNDQTRIETAQVFGIRTRHFTANIKFREGHGYYVNVTADQIESEFGVEKGLYFEDEGEALGYAVRKRLDWVLALRAKFGG